MRRSNLILILVIALDILLLGMMVALMLGIRDGAVPTAIEQQEALRRVTMVLGGAAAAFSVVGLMAFLVQRLLNKN